MQEQGGKNTITRRGLFFVALWSALILLLYALGGYAGARQLLQYKTESEKARMSVFGSEPARPAAQPGIKPVDVVTGIYINYIGEFSLREGSWAADFDIWFRWTGAGVDPGKNFRLVNGEIDSREKIESYARNGERYERYRVNASFKKFFDPGRFPFSDEVLAIQVQDAAHGFRELRYVPDESGSGISASGFPNYLELKKVMIKNEPPSPVRGPSQPVAESATGTRLVFAMLVDLPSAAIYMRTSQALFASVVIAFIAFFIKPSFVDPRFGLGIGAVFAAVANNIAVQAALPPPVQVTLLQMAYAAGLATIILTLIQSAISLYILDTLGDERLYHFFDKASFAAFLAGYTGVNLALPIVAYG